MKKITVIRETANSREKWVDGELISVTWTLEPVDWGKVDMFAKRLERFAKILDKSLK